jgi:hypothetical protein
MGWVIVGAFAITFSVTILALIHRLTIAEPYLKSLFVSLIIELISAFFFLARMGFKEESNSKKLDELKALVGKLDGIDPKEVSYELIHHRLIAPPFCKDCGRDYSAIVYWRADYAQTLFNFEGRTPNFQPVNPRSEGKLHYYKSPLGVFKGFSTWVNKNGEQAYSQVVVIHRAFKFESPGKLSEICTNIVVRNKLVEFSYGPFTHYHMRFSHWSDTGLTGKMLLVKNGNAQEELEVGDIVLELD